MNLGKVPKITELIWHKSIFHMALKDGIIAFWEEPVFPF